MQAHDAFLIFQTQLGIESLSTLRAAAASAAQARAQEVAQESSKTSEAEAVVSGHLRTLAARSEHHKRSLAIDVLLLEERMVTSCC